MDGSSSTGRKRRISSTSSTPEKVYSVVSVMENGMENLMVVPYHWIDWEEKIVYYPRSKVGEAIRKWMKPKHDWESYPIKKTMLECGSKDRCDHLWRNYVDSSATQVESETDDVNPSPLFKRVCSPVVEASSTPKRVLSDASQLRRSPRWSSRPNPRSTVFDPPMPKLPLTLSPLSSLSGEPPHSQVMSSSPSLTMDTMEVRKLVSDFSQIPPSQPQGVKSIVVQPKRGKAMGSGNVENQMLDMKTFQYQVLMRLTAIEDAIDNLREQFTTNPISGNKEIPNMALIESYDEFLLQEEKLKDDKYYQDMVHQMRLVGIVKNNPRKSLRNVFDGALSSGLQAKFNRDGGKRIKVVPGVEKKHGIGETLFYKCVRDALTQQGFTHAEIWCEVGNVLKGRIPYKKGTES